MDYEMLMSKRDCIANFAEKPQSFLYRQSFLVTILINSFALNMLHYEVRSAVGSRAALKQGADVGVLKIGQYLSLRSESVDDLLRVDAMLDYFYGHLPLEFPVYSFGKIDHAEAATSNFTHKSIWSQQLTEQGIFCRVVLREVKQRLQKKPDSRGVGVQQGFDFSANIAVMLARFIKEADLLSRRQPTSIAKKALCN